MSSLKKQAFSASIWFSVAFGLTKVLAFIRLAIMARLLTQDQFGLLAIIVLVVASLWALSDAGIEVSVVQKQEASDKWLHTAWQMSWMRGVILAGLCWLSAYPVALFFHQPELTMLLSWAALIPLIHGFMSLGYPLLQKSLNFKKRVWVDLTKEGVFTIVAITLALWWQADVVALLIGLLAGTAAAVLTSYMVHEYRPRMVFDMKSAREIMRFGAHLLGAGVLIFLMTNMDDAIVGRLLGMEKLGQYAIAFALSGLMTSQLVGLLNAVLFPTMSMIQDDHERLQRIVGSSLRLMVGVLTPIFLLSILVHGLLIQIVLGKQWLVIAPVLLVLIAMGWVRGIATVFGPVLLARGRSKVIHKMKWVEFLFFAACIVPAVMAWGTVGAAVTLLLVYMISLALHIRAVSKEIDGMLGILNEGVKGVLPGLFSFGFFVALESTFHWSFLENEWFALCLFAIVWSICFYKMEWGFVRMVRAKEIQVG